MNTPGGTKAHILKNILEDMDTKGITGLTRTRVHAMLQNLLSGVDITEKDYSQLMSDLRDEILKTNQ